MSVHKRPDSQYWQIRFKIAGRTIRRATGCTERAAAEELEETLRRALWRQIKLGERHYTWDQAVEQCTAEDSTQASWERTLRSIERLNRFLTGAPLAEITRENIVKIRTALTRHTYLNADKKPVPLAPATINRDLAVLRSILKRCAGEWKMLDACPVVPLFRIDKVDPLWVSREHAIHFCAGSCLDGFVKRRDLSQRLLPLETPPPNSEAEPVGGEAYIAL